MSGASRIYVGHVVHRRLKPRQHRLRYGCFWLLLDLDEVPALAARLRLFGHNRRAALSFRDRDHGDGKSPKLRAYVEARLAESGIALGAGSVRLLCMPRVAGYGFNPLSIYFCHGEDGTIRAILWEVNNTFGERHSYLIEATPDQDGIVRQRCGKHFFVSPFMDQDLTYDFRVGLPGDDVSVAIRVSDSSGPLLLASLAGTARTITDANLLALLVRQPLLTLKVISAIHWEALKLWLKGIGLRRKPTPPPWPVTVVRAALGPPIPATAAATDCPTTEKRSTTW